MAEGEGRRVRHSSEEYNRSLLRAYGRLATADTYRAVIDALRSEMLIMLGYSSVWLQLVRPDTGHVLMLDCGGPVEASVKALLRHGPEFREAVHGEDFLVLPYEGDRFINAVLGTRDVYVVADARTHPLTDKDIVSVTGNRTMVCLPLVLAEKTIGCLSTGTFFDEGVMVPDEAQLGYLRQLANHVAVAIDRVRFLGERREALEALQSTVQELEFRSFLLDSVLDGVIVRDVADMRVLYVNEAMCVLTGRTRDELMTQQPAEWLAVTDGGPPGAHFACARESGSETVEALAHTGRGFQTAVQVRTSVVVHQGREVLMSLVREVPARTDRSDG